jgi:hypothetical protein
MNWCIIDKSKTVQPTVGKYNDWKPQLAEEGLFHCVYCAIMDTRLGGIRNFHVEHYRPKSLFPDLCQVITNLFYACPICNVFKSNDWHDVTDNFEDIFYPDPSTFDYKVLFEMDEGGVLFGKNKTGAYIINKLGLNRNQLIIDRQFTVLLKAYNDMKIEYREIRDKLIGINSSESRVILQKMVDAFDVVIDKKDHMYEAAPYKFKDTKRI